MTRSNKRQTYSKKSPRRWTSSVDIRCRKVNEIFQVFLFHKIFNSHSPMKVDTTCMEPWVSGCIHPLIGGHCKVAHLCHKMWVCSFGGVWRFSLNIRPDHPQLFFCQCQSMHLVQLAAGKEGDPGHLQPDEAGKQGQLKKRWKRKGQLKKRWKGGEKLTHGRALARLHQLSRPDGGGSDPSTVSKPQRHLFSISSGRNLDFT